MGCSAMAQGLLAPVPLPAGMGTSHGHRLSHSVWTPLHRCFPISTSLGPQQLASGLVPKGGPPHPIAPEARGAALHQQGAVERWDTG